MQQVCDKFAGQTSKGVVRFRPGRGFGLGEGVLLAAAAVLKLAYFAPTAQYFANNLMVSKDAANLLVGLLGAFELCLAALMLLWPTVLVVQLAGWVFICFAGWHLAGLAMGASACPCLGPVTALMNAKLNQIVLAVLCVGVGVGLLGMNVSKRKVFL